MRVSLKDFEKPIFFWVGIIVFRLVLDISYINFVSPLYAYSGFGLDFNTIKYIESIVVLLGVSLATPKLLSKPSDYLLFTLLYAFLVPLLSYYALDNQNRFHLYLAILCCALVYIFTRGRRFHVPSIRYGAQISLSICFFLTVLTTAWFLYSSGVRYFNLDLTKVYEYRQGVSEASYVGVMAYIVTWSTKVVGPVLMGYALCRRNNALAALILAVHVLWFGFSSHKAVLFYPILIGTMWVWFQRTRAMAPILLVVSAIILMSLGLYLLYDDKIYGSLFARRVFFVGAKNTFLYFDFFSENARVFWANSLASNFIEYHYSLSPAKLMGYIQNTEAHVNNSFVSAGYMHAGVPGLMLYGVLAGLLFRLIDSLASNYVQVLLVLSALLIPSRSLLLSADLPTALLTHGIAFSLVIAILMKNTLRYNES